MATLWDRNCGDRVYTADETAGLVYAADGGVEVAARALSDVFKSRQPPPMAAAQRHARSTWEGGEGQGRREDCRHTLHSHGGAFQRAGRADAASTPRDAGMSPSLIGEAGEQSGSVRAADEAGQYFRLVAMRQSCARAEGIFDTGSGNVIYWRDSMGRAVASGEPGATCVSGTPTRFAKAAGADPSNWKDSCHVPKPGGGTTKFRTFQ